MNRRAAFLVLVVFAILAALAVGRLFEVRFATGDVFPPYSSLRADPLGTRAFYESLDRLPSLRVERHFRSFRRIPEGPGAALLILGLPPAELSGSAEEIERLESFVKAGGRLVVALSPEGRSPSGPAGGTSTNTSPGRLRRPAAGAGAGEAAIQLAERWGFGLASRPLDKKDGKEVPADVVAADPSRIPDSFRWHSPAVLVNAGDAWRAVLRRGTNAVMMERTWGAGSVVLCADSFPYSNEALRHARSAALLAWTVGGASRVVFDETHLGVRQESGFATLAREYRLQLFAGCLAVLAFLFIWRAATSFAPPAGRTEEAGQPVTGRGAADGFVSLARRNVAPADLLALCLTEWTPAGHGERRVSGARLLAVQAVVDRENRKPASRRDTVAVYREIAAILSTRREGAPPESNRSS